MNQVRKIRTGTLSVFAISGLLAVPSAAAAANKAEDRLMLASTVLSESMHAGDKGIPDDILKRSHCAVIVPGLKKGAFFVSGEYGKGFITCRKGGAWSAPAAIRMEGGGIGLQFGGSETDLILLVMNDRGSERLMSSKFTLGAEGEVAAGPVGRDASAETDGKLTAEILAWSRSRGVFAGISLKGATLRPDEDDNAELYGQKLGTRDVLNGSMAVPPAGIPLVRALEAYSPYEKH